MPHRPQALLLSRLTEEACSVFRARAARKKIQLSHSIADDLRIFADYNAMMAILINLLDNALKYTPEGGQISIQAKEKEDFVQVQIEDTGVGIESSELPEIFLLKKSKSTRGTQGEKGTGPGLHLVQEPVKLNEGNISVASEVSKGTTFETVLPKQQQTAS